MTNSEHQLAPKAPTQEMHPMQQVIVAEDGVVRFRSNAIVRYLLDNGGIDLNALAWLNFSIADQNQLAQLIGYSVSGFGDLSYADPALVEQADAIAAKLYEPRPSAHVELLPCPFCGAEPLLRESPGPLWVVQCLECGAEASSRTDVRDVAIECWNRRAPSSPPSAETSAADRVDAERWRWLRANEHYRVLVDIFNFRYGQVEHWTNEQNEAKMDAAIDAARAKG